tara:strand:- start:3126 stop:3917 length:792 start_codon:yes stop_codon:yes gene_type:complete
MLVLAINITIYSAKHYKMKYFARLFFVSCIIVSFTTVTGAKTKDCFESVNRAVFSFNIGLDKIVFKPVAKGYSYLPNPIKTGVKNATNNVSYFVQIPNQFLQGKFRNGIKDTGRFLINSTVGIFGLFDPASKLGLSKSQNEDYGQTLGAWGVSHGCYIVLPVLGPTTLRDSVGKVGNVFLDPFYLSTVGNKDLMLGNNLGDQTYWGETVLDKTNWRAEHIRTLEDLEKNSVDLYSSVRSLYLQRRDYLTNNGDSSDDEWKDFK